MAASEPIAIPSRSRLPPPPKKRVNNWVTTISPTNASYKTSLAVRTPSPQSESSSTSSSVAAQHMSPNFFGDGSDLSLDTLTLGNPRLTTLQQVTERRQAVSLVHDSPDSRANFVPRRNNAADCALEDTSPPIALANAPVTTLTVATAPATAQKTKIVRVYDPLELPPPALPSAFKKRTGSLFVNERHSSSVPSLFVPRALVVTPPKKEMSVPTPLQLLFDKELDVPTVAAKKSGRSRSAPPNSPNIHALFPLFVQ